MSKTNSSFNNLKTFITSLATNNESTVDPYNTFRCKFEFVKPYHNPKKYKYIKGSLVKLIDLDDWHTVIEDLKLPDVIIDGGTVSLLHGKYNLGTTIPLPVDNKFSVSFLNIAPSPIIETLMYPWMKACVGVDSAVNNEKEGELTDLDYPRADFTVSFPHLKLLTPASSNTYYPVYKYLNTRPISIETFKPSNKPATSLYRTVTFTFDYFICEEQKDNKPTEEQEDEQQDNKST